MGFEDDQLRAALKRVRDLEEAALAVACNAQHSDLCKSRVGRDCNCGLERIRALVQEKP